MPHPHGHTGSGRLPQPPPFTPPKTRRGPSGGCLALILIAVVMLAIVIGLVSMFFRSSAVNADTPTAQDGKLTFAVTRSSCAKAAKSAATRTCTVSIRVRNVGQEGRVVYPGFQKLVDTKEARYAAARLLDRAGKALTPTRVEPGGSFAATLEFLLPRNSRPHSLELHDSALSRGVRLPLA